jgi:hypothetical protein
MFGCVLCSCAIACGLLAFVRSRLGRNETITHNDVAGPVLTIIGTLLAVMMSFMVVGVWQEYDNAAQTAQQEASALSDLHHLASAYPQPEQSRLQNAIDRYIQLVLNEEWPAMRRGGESRVAHDAAYEIEDLLVQWQPRSLHDQALQDRGEGLAGTFLDNRRNRILANRQGIPIVLWATMLFTGALTVLFSFYFRVDRPTAHYIMVITESSIIALIFSLIAELDYPFRGDIAIDPYSFMHVMNAMHGVITGG